LAASSLLRKEGCADADAEKVVVSLADKVDIFPPLLPPPTPSSS